MAESAPFKKIPIRRDDTAFDACVVGQDDAPGFVMLQEWWGVDYEIKHHAQKITQLGPGFETLTPDLCRGKVGLDVAEAQHLMDGLDWQGAVKDVDAMVNWLEANGSRKAAKALEEKLNHHSAFFFACFYSLCRGKVGLDVAEAQHLMDGLDWQGAVKDVDAMVNWLEANGSRKAAKALEEKLEASGIPYEVHTYPGNTHSFTNRSPDRVKRRKGMGMEDEHEAAVELAWAGFTSLMARHLSSED